jgi:hypothetical protein
MCDYCKDDFLEDDLAEHILHCTTKADPTPNDKDTSGKSPLSHTGDMTSPKGAYLKFIK